MSVQKQRSELNIDVNGHETAVRGNPMFPCSAYWWDLTNHMYDEIPWHWHEEIEVLFVKSGALRLRINDNTLLLNENEGIFINSNVVHSIRTASNEISTLNSLVFNADILSGTTESVFAHDFVRPLIHCHALPFILFHANTEWTKTASLCIHDAYVAYDEEEFGYELVVREKMSHMLYQIITNNRQTINRQSKSEDKDITRIKTMMSYIHQNYPDKICLQQIAAAANISERECLRCFKKTIGISPIQYLLKYRLSVASNLLADSDLTMTEICDKTGFDNSSHFSRAFKSNMNCTPSEYRKRQ